MLFETVAELTSSIKASAENEDAGACCIFIIFSKARIPKLCKLAIAQTVQSS